MALFLYKTFTICLNSHRATKEANQVGSYLHHFGFNTDDPDEKSRVKLLSLKVLQQKVIFMPCGMFQIDLKLMFMVNLRTIKGFTEMQYYLFYFFFPLKMIGAIATYILILIQFDVAMNQGPIHTGGNDTIENSTQVSIQ